jgi:peptide-methionine (S)-S-oxide reductase
MNASASPAVATLAGGCFWCLEAAFEQFDGVVTVLPGYMGGHDPAPTYEKVCGGDSGHAEVVQIRFDPAKISYETLLDVFFAIHDPTTPNRQGNDVGTQYRSAIFHHDAAQEAAAGAAIAGLDAEGIWPRPVVTEVTPAGPFFAAEEYVVAPKAGKVRRSFAALLKADSD